MRPRTKKHFAERYERCKYLVVDDPASLKGNWHSLFGDFPADSELHLEIGCGKGAFILGKAIQNPDVLFVAMEVVPNVLLTALERVDAMPEVKNVRFISGDARLLGDYFAEDEVDRIYLNFSDPWPRKKQYKNRLSHPNFLKIYSTFLKKGAEIHQKTDNQDLFDFSVESYRENGFSCEILETAPADNIMTEYETKFTELGMPIYRCVAKRL